MGLPRKRNYTGRWDVLIDKSTKCLNRLFEIAAKKKRSYILDQVGSREFVVNIWVVSVCNFIAKKYHLKSQFNLSKYKAIKFCRELS